MKKYLLYTIAAVSFMGMTTSCSDFGDVNIDPEHPNEQLMDYSLMFGNAQVQALGSDWDVWRNGIIYTATMLQHVSTAQWSQGVFYTYDNGYNAALWDALYSGDRAAVRDVCEVLRNWENDEWYGGNDYQYARILRVYIFHRLTDLYGDIPYSQAGNASEYGYPKYDTQESIYNDLLKELDEAQGAIDVNAVSELGSADIYFGGDAQKWKKMANSLMLRIAMRMTKVDEAKAEEWVKKAVENGIIMSNEDNAYMLRTDGLVTKDSSEPYAKIYWESDAGKFFLSETFVNMLKSTNDPRLPLIGTIVADPTITYSNDNANTGSSADYANWVGLPVGYETTAGNWWLGNAASMADYIKTVTGEDGKETKDFILDENDKPIWKSNFPIPNRLTYSNPTSPTFIVTYAENMLLLAEAAVRGWVTDKTAEEYYNEGVRAAMEQFSIYSAASSLYNTYLNDAAISDYLAANPFDASKAYEQINTQYYIATFCDEYESFANWRRSGYPVLTAVDKDYPSCVTNGQIPRRFVYPVSEQTANTANFQEAIQRQGLTGGSGDMVVRMWWDKE